MRKRGLLALLALLVGRARFRGGRVRRRRGAGRDEAPAEAPAEEPPADEPAEEPPAEEPAEPPAEGGGVTALPSSSCGELEFGGEGEPQVLLASDLPLQGASRTQTTQINDAIRFVLDQRGWKAGDVNVAFQACDDATAQAGEMGLRQVQPERPGLRRERERDRRHRDVQLRLRGDRSSRC